MDFGSSPTRARRPADPTDRASEPTGQLFQGTVGIAREVPQSASSAQRCFRFPPVCHSRLTTKASASLHSQQKPTHGCRGRDGAGNPLACSHRSRQSVRHHPASPPQSEPVWPTSASELNSSSLVIPGARSAAVVTQFQLMKFQLIPFRLRQNQNQQRGSRLARGNPPSAPLSPVDSRK